MTAKRLRVASDSPWEDRVQYSRAVRVGDMVFVSGTTSDGHDAYEQAKGALLKIERALGEAGATLADVVRTRMYVVDIADWERVGRAHADAFAGVMPAATMVEVARLIAPDLLVEIEVDAYIA